MSKEFVYKANANSQIHSQKIICSHSHSYSRSHSRIISHSHSHSRTGVKKPLPQITICVHLGTAESDSKYVFFVLQSGACSARTRIISEGVLRAWVHWETQLHAEKNLPRCQSTQCNKNKDHARYLSLSLFLSLSRSLSLSLSLSHSLYLSLSVSEVSSQQGRKRACKDYSRIFAACREQHHCCRKVAVYANRFLALIFEMADYCG
jgi:hypothetical protein